MSTFCLYFRTLFGTFFLKVFLEQDCNGKKDPCAVFGCYNDRLFPNKYTVNYHISNTKLEEGDHYHIQTRHKEEYSPRVPPVSHWTLLGQYLFLYLSEDAHVLT